MHVHNCIMAVQVWLNIVWAAPALIFVQFFSTELITELRVRDLFNSRRKRLPSRYCSVALFTTFHLWKFSKHVYDLVYVGIHSATNFSELALTFTRVAVSRESNQLVISSLAWRNISFFVVSQDLKHFSMSVKLDLNLNQCHETNNGENYWRKG